MDQRFEGTPQAEIRLEGRKLVRGDVANDWGSQLLWEIRRNGQVVATAESWHPRCVSAAAGNSNCR